MEKNTIQIGGKERGLLFDEHTVEVFIQCICPHVRNFVTLVESTPSASVYAALYSCCKQNEKNTDFTYQQVTEWVNELIKQRKYSVVQKVVDEFLASPAYKTICNALMRGLPSAAGDLNFSAGCVAAATSRAIKEAQEKESEPVKVNKSSQKYYHEMNG